MPFCVIYGFGTFIAFHILAPVEHNYVVLFLAGAFFATLFEFATAKAMLKLLAKFGGTMIICHLIMKALYAWKVL